MMNEMRKWREDIITDAERASSNGNMKTVYEMTRMPSNERKGMTIAIPDRRQGPKQTREEGGRIIFKQYYIVNNVNIH